LILILPLQVSRQQFLFLICHESNQEINRICDLDSLPDFTAEIDPKMTMVPAAFLIMAAAIANCTKDDRRQLPVEQMPNGMRKNE
jgi:hypothetical protein